MAEENKAQPARRTRRDPYRLTGETFGGRYHLEEFAGMGSFGAVYRATDGRVGRTVAVKILKPDLGDDETAVARELFQREALTAGRLMHPHIVAVTDVGEESDFAYLVMEWLDGYTLEDELRRRVPFSPEEAASLLAPIADALQAAHDAGVIHRDLKPANIYIGRRERPFVKVLDFGIAKVVTSATAATASRIAGTASYMSPEQITGSRIDRRTDIYSLGIVLYQMLVGELPFKGESQGHIIQQHIVATPPSLAEARPDLPPALSSVIQRALGKLPEARQQSAQELYSEFMAALKSQSAPQPTHRNVPSHEQATEVISRELPPTVWSGHNIAQAPAQNSAQQQTIPVTGQTREEIPSAPIPAPYISATDSATPGKAVARKPAVMLLFSLAGAILLPLLGLLALKIIFSTSYVLYRGFKLRYLAGAAAFGLLFGATVSALRWSKRTIFFALGGACLLLLLLFLAPALTGANWRFDDYNRYRYLLLHHLLAGAALGLAVCALRSPARRAKGVQAYLLSGAACSVILLLLFYIYQLTTYPAKELAYAQSSPYYSGYPPPFYYAIEYVLIDKIKLGLLFGALGFIIGLVTHGMRISYKESMR
ncbi:MAG: protein kinase, partial [Acidobacteriota bacterium]|nr:protein kinase [Acidobacteriota bacterium]